MDYRNEEDLIARLKAGDSTAFKMVFDQYYRPLTLFAMRYLGDAEEAKEVVQELFIRLWSRQDSLRIQFSLKMYLYQSTRNACLNYIESSKVNQRRMRDFSPELLTKDDALEHMIAAEQEEVLMRAIDNLPEKCREIFFLSRMGKLSNQAIATKLNISIKTVEAQISIALKRLMKSLISLLLLLSF